jgi:hypothetical protein
MKVYIDSRSPIRMEVDTDELGAMFAAMNAEEQLLVLGAAVDAMAKHPLQWDYIAIELSRPENDELRGKLRGIVADMEATP